MLNPNAITLLVVSQFFFYNLSLAESTHPDNSSQADNRIPIFYVLLKDDANASLSAQEIMNAESGAQNGFNIAALNKFKNRRVTRMLPESSYKNFRGKNSQGNEAARSKLGRYLVIEFDESIDIDQVKAEFESDPLVEYVATDELMHPSVACPESGQSITNYSSVSKTWGFTKVRESYGWNYSTGHAYMGIVDLGVQMNHAALRDFNGNTYLGGNFHLQLAFDLGDRFSTNGPLANPFSDGQAYIGEVD